MVGHTFAEVQLVELSADGTLAVEHRPFVLFERREIADLGTL